MKRLLLTIVLAAGVVGLMPHGVSAQSALSLEIRGDANKPIGNFANDKQGVRAESDFGFGVDAVYKFPERFYVYGGYSRDVYGCAICGTGDHLRTQGAEAGLMVEFFGSHPQAQPFLRAGAVYQQLTVDLHDPNVANENVKSDWHLGFQLAGGLEIPVNQYLSFVPSVELQTYSVDMPQLIIPPASDTEDPSPNAVVGPKISQVSFQVGARFTLPRIGS